MLDRTIVIVWVCYFYRTKQSCYLVPRRYSVLRTQTAVFLRMAGIGGDGNVMSVVEESPWATQVRLGSMLRL